MKQFLAVLHSFLGSSAATSLAGYAGAAVIAAVEVVQNSGDISKLDGKTLAVAAVVAVVGRLAKDANKSNSPAPLAHAAEVVKQ